uniref:Uncharacterized protein n=1 Tax=Anguilla anguilla TaxID=7936 RepID=A0A0E9US82_ANGAN
MFLSWTRTTTPPLSFTPLLSWVQCLNRKLPRSD